jgi:hypothetical protein
MGMAVMGCIGWRGAAVDRPEPDTVFCGIHPAGYAIFRKRNPGDGVLRFKVEKF